MDPYTRLLKELYSKNKARTNRWSLNGSVKLSNALNNPHRSFKTIHVAGTNGKGSVCTKMAQQLMKNGYRVGLYTSPHISTFRERIQVNNELIDINTCQSLLEKVLTIDDNEISFFDYVTHLAFLYFQMMQVDIALIEVGLGGKLDSTNIITPQLSIITSIGLDHCELLGSTIEEITREKAGIIKKNVPILIGPNVPKDIILEIAEKKGAPLHFVEKKSIHYDEENQHIAKKGLELLQFSYYDDDLTHRPPCRLQTLQHEGVEVVIDVAHNPLGIESTLRSINKERQLDILFGLSASKDIRSCIKTLEANSRWLYPVAANHLRAAPLSKLLLHIQKECSVTNSTEESLTLALTNAKKHNSTLLIVGSIFLMEEVRDYFNLPQEKDPIEMSELNIANNGVMV